jgi:serine/threonine protein kinase
MADLGVGTRFGPYTIERLVGRGGMSVVYLAEDTRLGRRVALKVLAGDVAMDESFRARFLAESRTAASLEHPNIVPIHEAGEAEGHLYIAMRYVRGTDLATLLDQEGPLDPQRARSVIEQVAAALDAAHAEGLVHRDVKPANVLLAPGTERDLVYLSDFGVTRRTSAPRGPTATGQFLGTVEYAAPEQFEGRPVDTRTDVYALGCVLYECLTGEPPFRRDEQVAVMYAHLNEPPPSVTARRPEIPAGIDPVVARAMAKRPQERYASAGALAADAARALGPAREFPAPPRPSRRRAFVALAAVAAVAVGLVLAVALLSGDDPSTRTAAPPTNPTGATSPTGANSPTATPGLDVPPDAVVRVDAGGTGAPVVVEGVVSGSVHVTMAAR